MKKYRYPGIAPFSEHQRDVFFGRDKDIQNLKNLIWVRRQVLLYAKSGVGKTSLLNAGVLPLLKDKFTPLPIRFTAYTSHNTFTPLQIVVNKLNKTQETGSTILDELIEGTDYQKDLWYYFKREQLLNKDKTYILVFDQFEELFSYPEQQIDAFKNELARLVNGEVPDEIYELLANKPGLEDDERIDELYEDIRIKIVYAIRSDKLSLLNRLSDKIANIQRDFYELKPLDKQQAEQAVIKPAQTQGEDFVTRPFGYEPAAVQEIIRALSDTKNKEIETTQLQIVCQRIEQIVEQKQQNTLETYVEVSVNDLPEFKDIFLRFYETAVAGTSQPAQARKFIEDQLIRNGQRISLDERICLDYIDKEDLRRLTNAHLLRAEINTTGGFSYEISHDTLIEPILISREKRLEEEERLKAEERRREELRIAREKAEKERIEREKERRQQRRIIMITTIAAIVSIAFGLFGFWQMKRAEKNLKQAVKSRIESVNKDAMGFMDKEEFIQAQNKYRELLELYKQYPDIVTDTMKVFVNNNIEYIKEIDQKKNLFYRYMNEADSLIEKPDIIFIKKAYQLYKDARKIKYPYSDDSYKKFNIKWKQAMKQLKYKKDVFMEAGGAGKIKVEEINKFLKLIDDEKYL